MSLSFFIARRYLLSKRKANFINIISILSIAGIAFSTAALIIVLSVFNGLEDLLRSLNNSFDPEIKIEAREGKSFESSSELIEKIKSVGGVQVVTEVIQDYAYLRYRDANQVVIIKGVSDNFLEQDRIPEENIVEGELKLKDGPINYAIIGRGIQYSLSIATNDPLYPLQVYYIKSVNSVGLDPSRLYARQNIVPGAVFSIVQNFDENYVIVPLRFTQELFNYGNKRTSFEIKTEPDADIFKVEKAIQQVLGDTFNVLNHEEQHQDLYKLLKMEKLFTFLALTLLLVIGSINIFFTLMMLVLDKKKDVAILKAMGAHDRQVRNVFMAEGVLIAFSGAFVGLALGIIFYWVQQRYGILSMGMETSITQGYPIKVKGLDFIATMLVVTAITFLISLKPAKIASRIAASPNL
ncbi:MAG TPA: FtsX-like permease family protein [Chryseosolibacter sp.]|nr:FtsX-like permease family protein [Chryseosolibacter sp.]